MAAAVMVANRAVMAEAARAVRNPHVIPTDKQVMAVSKEVMVPLKVVMAVHKVATSNKVMYLSKVNPRTRSSTRDIRIRAGISSSRKVVGISDDMHFW